MTNDTTKSNRKTIMLTVTLQLQDEPEHVRLHTQLSSIRDVPLGLLPARVAMSMKSRPIESTTKKASAAWTPV